MLRITTTNQSSRDMEMRWLIDSPGLRLRFKSFSKILGRVSPLEQFKERLDKENHKMRKGFRGVNGSGVKYLETKIFHKGKKRFRLWIMMTIWGQQSRVRIRHLPQWSWSAAGSLCKNVENLRVERETYPWDKKRSWKNLISLKIIEQLIKNMGNNLVKLEVSKYFCSQI